MRGFRPFVVAMALALSGAAHGATLVEQGSYGAGQQVSGAGGVTLGPGRYVFRFSNSAPFQEFYAQLEKQSYWIAFCDFGEGEGEQNCANSVVPTIPLFEPVNPNLYQLSITVNPDVTTLTPDEVVVRTFTFDDCCTFAYDFIAGDAGTFSISYRAVPEPATWSLLILGAGLAGGAMRRRKSAMRLAHGI